MDILPTAQVAQPWAWATAWSWSSLLLRPLLLRPSCQAWGHDPWQPPQELSAGEASACHPIDPGSTGLRGAWWSYLWIRRGDGQWLRPH